MGTKNFSNANDLITFSRSSAGTALRKIAYGSELVTNGTFDTDTDWTKGTGWSISGGQATHVAGTGSNLSQSVSYGSAGTVYALSVDVVSISGGSGSIQARSGGTTTAKTISSLDSGTTVTLIYGHDGLNTDVAITTGAGTNITVDNVSVKEVLFDDASGDLTLFNHPADIPRIEYDADGNVLGLLVEESRTNLVTYSEDFSLSPWSRVNVFITSDAAAGPDGVSSADLLVASVVSSQHRLDLIPTSSAGTQTFSVYLKPDGYSDVWLRIGAIGSGFNLTDGSTFTTNAGITATAQEVGNGWYRCSITTTSAAANATVRINVLGSSSVADFAGDGTSGIYIYGAQLEAGAFPTSYIPTSGSTATRAADIASIPVSAFGYNQSEGSWLMEWDTADTDSVVAKYILSSGTSARVMYNNAGTSAYYSFDGSAVSTYTAPTPITLDGSLIKAAYAENESGSSVAHTGVLGTGSVNSDLLPNYNSTYGWSIGNLNNNQGFLNGHIKSIKYFPRKLTAAQLQELTS